MEVDMNKETPKQRNPIAKDLYSGHYRTTIIPNKKKEQGRKACRARKESRGALKWD